MTQYPHQGYYAVDIGMAMGDDISASASGVVRTAGNVNNYNWNINGNQVVIDHGNNFCTLYNHMSSVAVKVGQSVTRGQYLGGAGATGAADGVHLHWDTVQCSGHYPIGKFGSYEYPNGFYAGQRITSRNSVPAVWNPSIPSRGDLVAVDSAGVLWNYPANGSGAFEPKHQIGPGWTNAKTVWTIDWNSDGVNDIVTQWSDGILRFYPGRSTGGFYAYQKIGASWNGWEIAPGKLRNTDKYPGMIAKELSTGLLYYYPNASGNWLTTDSRIEIGHGWTNLSINVMDFNYDGNLDVLALNPADDLYAYFGNGAGGFSGNRKVGAGWAFEAIAPTFGFIGSGSRGLQGKALNGDVFYYPVTTTGFGDRFRSAHGFGPFQLANSQNL